MNRNPILLLSMAAILAGCAGSRSAPSSGGMAEYETQEPAIYRAVLEQILTDPTMARSRQQPAAVCIPTHVEAADTELYAGWLLHGVGMEGSWAPTARYDQLARRMIRRRGTRVESPRRLDPLAFDRGMSARPVPAAECDTLALYRIYRPLVVGATAFLMVSYDVGCMQGDYRFAVTRRAEGWEIEGYRAGIPVGECWGDTTRSRGISGLLMRVEAEAE